MNNKNETLIITDTMLKSTVVAGLEWDPRIKAAHIGVIASSGVVTLSGHVETYAEKHLAEAVVSHLAGVKAIAQEIEVRLTEVGRVADDDIASAALARFANDVSVLPDAIRIKVEKGVVTLTGQVEWEYQRAAAAWDIRGMSGIVEIFNEITVKPNVNIANITAEIMQALDRSPFFAPQIIDVSADGGSIHLIGKVRSWNDRRVAEQATWAAPGVTAVRNEITVLQTA